MKTTFAQGIYSPLPNDLGIHYGHLSVVDEEGLIVSQELIVSMEQGANVLVYHMNERGLSSEDATTAYSAMSDASLLLDDADVVKVIEMHKLPSDYSNLWQFTFQLHEDCARNPLPHGHIYAPNGIRGPVVSDVMSQGFLNVKMGVTLGSLDVVNGIILLKHMIAEDLPLNRKDAKRRFNDLPRDVRLALKEQSRLSGPPEQLAMMMAADSEVGYMLGQILAGIHPRPGVRILDFGRRDRR